MKKNVLILFLLFLLVIKIVYGIGGSFGVAVSVGFDSDGDGTPDATDPDDDNDGILDENDCLTGNSSFVNSNTITVNVTVNDDINLTQSFNGTKKVKIMNGSTVIVEFEFNFCPSVLNLANVTVDIQTDSAAGSVLVKGINLEAQDKTKTVYADDLSNFTSVCIKDDEINSIGDVSAGCNGTKEALVSCDGILNSGYKCKDIGTRYNVSGLNHSGVKEQCGDNDGDGYGTYCPSGSDCNDGNTNIYPGATEVCNGIDDDCDDIIDEGCVSAPSGGGGGGGVGKAVAPEKVAAFSINKGLIKVVLKPGENIEDSMEISNRGETTLDITLDVKRLKEIVFLSEGSFALKPAESKTIDVMISIPSNQEPGIYVGRITIKSDSIEKIVDVIIEVESKEALFDVGIEIPTRYKNVFAGEEVLAQINIYNLGVIEMVDAIVDYSIQDMEGNVIVSQQKTVSVETQASLVVSLDIPSTFKAGSYVFSVKVSYDNSVATATSMFAVLERPVMLAKPSKFTSINILIGVLSLILLCFVIFIVLSIINLGYGIRKRRLPSAKMPEEIKKEEMIKKEMREEEMISNISKGLYFLKYGDIKSARGIYAKGVATYRTLSEEEKRRIYPSLKKLYDKIMLFSKRR